MSSDREPVLGYESGRLFSIATISAMDRLFRGGYAPVASERRIDEEVLATAETPLGFHRPVRDGDIWTPKAGEEGKVSTVYLVNFDAPDNQDFYLAPKGTSDKPSIGITPVIPSYLKRELDELLKADENGAVLASSMRLDSILQQPEGAPAEISRERQEAVLAYLDEYLRLTR